MEKQHGFFKSARKCGKQVALSLVALSAVVFGHTPEASAKIYSTETFMTREAKNIFVLAHPTAEYVGSEYQGNGTLDIYYHGFPKGLLTLRVQGTVDDKGYFDSLYPRSDDGFVPPFTMLGMMRSALAAYLRSASDNAEDPDARRALDYLANALANGNGRTISEAYLIAESYLNSY